MKDISQIRGKKAFIIDMDGVIYHGNKLLNGAAEFVDWLERSNKSYLFLTNSSERSPIELAQK
jgi:NagD protein